jgi:DNA-binding transcriptional regulator YdaS (Cro superfamily)
MNAGLKKAVKVMGGQAALARQLGLTRAAVHRWDLVPAKWIIDIERLTGVSREKLRPDLYVKS